MENALEVSARAGAEVPEKPAAGLVWRYAIAAGTVTAALGLRLWLDEFFGNAAPYVVFFLALVFIVRFAGLGPSLFAILASLLVVDYFFVPPRHALGFFKSCIPIGSIRAPALAWLSLSERWNAWGGEWEPIRSPAKAAGSGWS